MAQKRQVKQDSAVQPKATQSQEQSTYAPIINRMNSIMSAYGNLPIDSLYSAFGRASAYWANMPSVQNSRIKALNPLPCDFSKAELNSFLVNPQNSELQLQQVGEGLRWTAYSWQKLIKSYADMLQFHSYAIPQHITADELKSDEFKREFRLVDKIIKALSPRSFGQKAAMQALTQGKVFYVPRYSVDKSHNKVNHFFMQELPKQWCTIIGENSVSDWVVSFNLMYFMQMGTDFRQFGDLFTPYMSDFNDWLMTPENKRKQFKNEKFVYATRNNTYEQGLRSAWVQDGRFFYYVSLPIEKVWTFEIDESTAIVASPLSGLMQTFAQQADYEAAQLSLILNPLIKIFTGEIPYYSANEAKEDDGFRLSLGGRAVFEEFWRNLMASNNTAGTAFFTAPVQNIRSHDYPESANSNSVASSFLNYGLAKSGSQGVIPITNQPTEEAVKASEKLEPKYAQAIYGTMERMVNYILNNELNLNWEYNVRVFGDIYSDDIVRANALKELNNGDVSAFFILAALDEQSILDKAVMCDMVRSIELLDKLQAPQTAYTQSGRNTPKSDTNGAPTKTETKKKTDEIDKSVNEGVE